MDSQLLNLIHLHGLNYPEFRILLTVHYESPVPQEFLARFSIEPICETSPTIAQIDEMQRVIQSCIDIGLIKVYDQKECQKDQKTWAAITNQSFFRWKQYRPGDVGFTDKGAALFYTILAEIRARDGQGLFDGCYWVDEDPLTQKIFLMGTTEADFIEKSRALKSGPLRSMTSRGIKIKSIGAIQKGGPWWFNRFVLLDVIYFVEVETEEPNQL